MSLDWANVGRNITFGCYCIVLLEEEVVFSVAPPERRNRKLVHRLLWASLGASFFLLIAVVSCAS